jgi:hypothetical protein
MAVFTVAVSHYAAGFGYPPIGSGSAYGARGAAVCNACIIIVLALLVSGYSTGSGLIDRRAGAYGTRRGAVFDRSFKLSGYPAGVAACCSLRTYISCCMTVFDYAIAIAEISRDSAYEDSVAAYLYFQRGIAAGNYRSIMCRARYTAYPQVPRNSVRYKIPRQGNVSQACPLRPAHNAARCRGIGGA